ncbi:endonuclease/exonuclease/phosphatase family protein [Allosphingosinicella vermicomposti]|uniref:endonuclease/exonuclease/phosphatase family protein n=1 Tax=Allosphingosinicella vermicomposti TaxID=614671 RepID=UPI000D113F2E|nr:endonuclease/exonuclease/phosphatase family protein [Allosphingosinicella vermicomposti]
MRLIATLTALAGITLAAPLSAEPLRVMSFNVRLPLAQDGANDWPHRKAFMARLVHDNRPDILATQELTRVQGDYLRGRLPGYAWFGVDRLGGRVDEHMGVFYRRDRLRLVDLGNFWLSDTPHVPGSISWGNLYPRMVTWGLFEGKDKRRFYLFNTHLPYRPEDEAARMKAGEALLKHIANLPAEIPVVLTGDFNTAHDSEVHALLSGTLTDVRTAASSVSGPEATFHAFTGTADRRIDWIFARGLRTIAVKTDAANRNGRYPSDHFPVIADFDW